MFLSAAIASYLVLARADAEEGRVPDTGKAAPQRKEDGVPEMELSLRQSLLLAVEKNLQIRAASLTPKIYEDDIEQAVSEFDTVVTTDVAGQKKREQTASQLAGAAMSETNTVDFGISATRKLRTGTAITTAFENSRQGNNSTFVQLDPAYQSNVGVSLSQPLLRGRGRKINEGPIDQARNRRQMGVLELRDTALGVAAQTERAYWNLVFAVEDLDVQRFSLQQAQQLLKDNQEKVAAGTATRNDVIQAEAEVAGREESIILSERLVLEVEDRLKTITNIIEDPAVWDRRLKPTTRPKLDDPDPEAGAALEEAFSNRPDYLSAKVDLDNREIAIVLARNGRYPELDLTASFSLNGVTGNFGNTVDSLVSTDFYGWGAGVSLTLPVGLRSGRSLWKRRNAERAQALLLFKELGNSVVAEVRAALRNVATARKRIQTAETSRRLQEAKLASGLELFRVGRATTNDTLEFQLDVARSKSNYLEAVLEFRKAMVDLEAAKGTLLSTRGLAASRAEPSTITP